MNACEMSFPLVNFIALFTCKGVVFKYPVIQEGFTPHQFAMYLKFHH